MGSFQEKRQKICYGLAIATDWLLICMGLLLILIAVTTSIGYARTTAALAGERGGLLDRRKEHGMLIRRDTSRQGVEGRLLAG